MLSRRALLRSLSALPLCGAVVPLPKSDQMEPGYSPEEWLISHLTHRACCTIRANVTSQISTDHFRYGAPPVAYAFHLPTDIRASNAYEEYVKPASFALARFINRLGPSVMLKSVRTPKQLTLNAGRLVHESYNGGIPLRGQLGYDGVKQQYLVIFDLFAEAV